MTKYHRKTTLLWKRDAIMLTAFMIGLLSGGIFTKATDFFRGINKDGELISPVVGNAMEIKMTDNEIPKEKSRVWKIVDEIWRKESNRGTAPDGLHRTCAAKGKVNEWGYLPVPGHCFNTREEGEMTVALWVSARINFMTENQLLCNYNLGKKINRCDYLDL